MAAASLSSPPEKSTVLSRLRTRGFLRQRRRAHDALSAVAHRVPEGGSLPDRLAVMMLPAPQAGRRHPRWSH